MSEYFENFSAILNTDSLIQLLISITVAIVVGAIITWLIFRLLKWSSKREPDSVLLRLAATKLRNPAYFLIPLLLFNIVFPAFGVASSEVFSEFVAYLTRTALYIVGAWFLMRVVNIFIEVIKERNNIAATNNNYNQRKLITQLQFIQRIGSVIIVTLAVAFILLEFKAVRQIGAGLLASAGVTGIIIGFAAQKSIANLLAGLQIAFTQPIKIDDVVIIEGEFGRVEEITLTYVVIRIWDQRRIIVPLNYFIEKPFQNWTRTGAELLGSVFIYADYQTPTNAIRDKLTALLQDHPLWDGRVNSVKVTETNPTYMHVRLLMSSQNASDLFDLRCDVREAMVQFLQMDYPASLPKTRLEFSQKEASNLQQFKQIKDANIS